VGGGGVSVDGTPDGGVDAAGEGALGAAVAVGGTGDDGAEALADVVGVGDADDGAGAAGRERGAGRVSELPTVGAWGGSVAFGLRDSTLVFSRLTSSMRSWRRPPSFSACTLLLTSAS